MRKVILLFSVTAGLFLSFQCAYAQDSEEVVAIVNDRIITSYELDKAIEPFYAQLSKLYSGKELEDKIAQAKNATLRKLIENQIILDKSQEYDIEIDELKVSEKIDSMKKKFPNEEMFREVIKKEGISLKDLEDKYRDHIRIQSFISGWVGHKSKATFKELYEYYQAHQDKYAKDNSYTIGHILVRYGGDKTKEKAREQIREIRRLIVDGDSFEDLAREFSQGPYAKNGGLMKEIKPGGLKAELNQALKGLKEGEVSDIIETDLGFHLIKLYSFNDSDLIPFEEVEKEIKSIVEQEKFKKEYDIWIKQLWDESYVEIKKEF